MNCTSNSKCLPFQRAKSFIVDAFSPSVFDTTATMDSCQRSPRNKLQYDVLTMPPARPPVRSPSAFNGRTQTASILKVHLPRLLYSFVSRSCRIAPTQPHLAPAAAAADVGVGKTVELWMRPLTARARRIPAGLAQNSIGEQTDWGEGIEQF